ncbi:hypothetical protein PAMA_008321 [Pampus argenteus]
MTPWIKYVVFLGTFLLPLVKGDDDVSCALTEKCILPCKFQAGPDVVIHWIQMTGEILVHTYYHNQDQLSLQDQRFRGRTSLLQDQISRGDASLQLTGVELQDQGRYKCYTSTISGNKESFINLHLDAPVSKVDIQQEENNITCRSNGIFPKPKLTWSTSPQSSISYSSDLTQSPTETRLFNISSSLILPDNAFNLTYIYICTIRTDRSSKRAVLMTLSPISGSGTEMTIACKASDAPLTDFVWIFNHSQTILTWTGDHYQVSKEWTQQVKSVTRTGNLTLQGLSEKHEGMYTCEFSNPEGTNITNTFLSITDSPLNAGVTIGVTVGVLVVVAGLAGLMFWLREYKKQVKTTKNTLFFHL